MRTAGFGTRCQSAAPGFELKVTLLGMLRPNVQVTQSAGVNVTHTSTSKHILSVERLIGRLRYLSLVLCS